MVYKIFLGILVESYGTWLLFQRLDDSSKDSDIPKNVPFAFAINNRNTTDKKKYYNRRAPGDSGDLCPGRLKLSFSLLRTG